MNHIRVGPSGVVTCMQISRLPPTRTSILATGIVAPVGPYQAAKWSGSVHICQTSFTGASKVRSIVTEFCDRELSAIASFCLSP